MRASVFPVRFARTPGPFPCLQAIREGRFLTRFLRRLYPLHVEALLPPEPLGFRSVFLLLGAPARRPTAAIRSVWAEGMLGTPRPGFLLPASGLQGNGSRKAER